MTPCERPILISMGGLSKTMVLQLCGSDCATSFRSIKVGMRFPSSKVTITHSKKSEVRIANKQISHVHPINKADGSARSHSHSFSQDFRNTAEYT